jgi:pimeloyl-ACP methyl ester carboxylesterase
LEIIKKELNNVSVPTSVLTIKAQGNYKATVVCLHGFPDSNLSYIPLMHLLSTAGYDVWAPAMPGYETASASAQPDYYLTDLAATVQEWIDHDLGAKQIHLVGHDWGSPIASIMVAQNSNHVLSLISLAIPPLQYAREAFIKFPEQLWYSRYMAFFQLRGIAEIIIKRNNFKYLKQLWQRWSPTWEIPDDYLVQLESTFVQPLVLKATLQYYRCMLDAFSHKGKKVGVLTDHAIINVPSLFLSGKDDKCMSQRHFSPWNYNTTHYPAGASHQFINGGHFCPLEASSEITEHCLPFWQAIEHQHLTPFKA